MNSNKLLPLPAAIRAARLGGLFTLLLPGLALAAPSGASIVAGQASISTPQSNTTVINQSSQNAVINWQQFNVGQNESVQFNQPNASAAILNRVIGGSPSDIFGRIGANGRVFLVNPNGVLFGRNAQVDVGGLMASTLDIGNRDFMAGHYAFAGNSTATVANEGTINAGQGGFVVLAGDYVENSGIVQAQLGTVALGSGSAVTLDMNGDGLVNLSVDQAALSSRAGAANLGTLAAQGGTVIMTASVAQSLASTAVNNRGVVNASGIEERGGDIYLTAEGGGIGNSGTLNAAGGTTQAGGNIAVRGDGDILLAAGSGIDASGANGGTVHAVAGQLLTLEQGANTTVTNTGSTGKGGFAELSGHDVSLHDIVSLGHGGHLLIDPVDLTIGPGADSSSNFNQQLLETQLQNANGYGGDVAVVAGNSITIQSLTNGVLDGTNQSGAGTGGRLFLGIGSCTSDCFSNDFVPGGTSASFIKFDTLTDEILLDGALTIDAGQGTIDVGNFQAHAIALAADGDIGFGTLVTHDSGGTDSPDVSVVSSGGNISGSGQILASSAVFGPHVRLDSGQGSIDLGTNDIVVAGTGGSNVNLHAFGNINFGALTVADQSTSSGTGSIVDVSSGEGGIDGGLIAVNNDSSSSDLFITASHDIHLAADPSSHLSIAVSGYDGQDGNGNTAAVSLNTAGAITLDGGVAIDAEVGNVSVSGAASLSMAADTITINSALSVNNALNASILAVSEGGQVLVDIVPGSSNAGSAPAQIAGDVILDGKTGVTLGGDMQVNHLLILNDTGDIVAGDDALFLKANYVGMLVNSGNIDMSLSNLTVGSGTLPSGSPGSFESTSLPARSGTSITPTDFGFDPTMISQLGSLQPLSSSPNASFTASGSITLGDLTMNGDYLYLSSSNTSLAGPLAHGGSGPLFANFVPSNPTSGISLAGVDTLATSPNAPPLTLVYGSSQYTGAITADPNSTPLNVLPTHTNFVFATTGNVSGFDTLQTNGQVAELRSGVLTIRGQTTPPPPPPPPADDEVLAAGSTATQSVFQSTFGNTPGSQHILTGPTDEYGNIVSGYGSIEQQTDSDLTVKSCK
ncbi:MAG TPA: filamentous hemagglutinin N-terminal domain-containing protein [Stenotrophobium sp.]|nr:filamentous hemagglutinin N-terminal domain-containing protein [Stenotrophobium sp.]